jgi:hypothetical protein
VKVQCVESVDLTADESPPPESPLAEPVSLAEEVSLLGDANISLGDAKRLVGDANISLGDAERSVGDA